MNEHSYIRSVHRHLPHDLLSWKIHDPYQGGVPDAFYAGPNGQLWVEYKFTNLPVKKSSSVKVALSEQQKQWLQKLNLCNIPHAVILGTDQGGVVLEDYEFLKNLKKSDIETRLRSCRDIAAYIEAKVT